MSETWSCTFSPALTSLRDGGDAVDGELLFAVEGFQVEGDALELQGVEAALHDIGERHGGGERGLHGGAVIAGQQIVERGWARAVEFGLAGEPDAAGADRALGLVDGAEDGHLHSRGESSGSLTMLDLVGVDEFAAVGDANGDGDQRGRLPSSPATAVLRSW